MSVAAKKFSVLDTLHMLLGSWVKVTNNTIYVCWRRTNFVFASKERNLIPNYVSEEMFEKWVAIKRDASVSAKFTLEEAEIMQQVVLKNSDGIDVNHVEKDDRNDETMEEATRFSNEMKFLLHHLHMSLEQRGFEQIDEFKKFTGLDAFARK